MSLEGEGQREYTTVVKLQVSSICCVQCVLKFSYTFSMSSGCNLRQVRVSSFQEFVELGLILLLFVKI